MRGTGARHNRCKQAARFWALGDTGASAVVGAHAHDSICACRCRLRRCLQIQPAQHHADRMEGKAQIKTRPHSHTPSPLYLIKDEDGGPLEDSTRKRDALLLAPAEPDAALPHPRPVTLFELGHYGVVDVGDGGGLGHLLVTGACVGGGAGRGREGEEWALWLRGLGCRMRGQGGEVWEVWEVWGGVRLEVADCGEAWASLS